MVSRFQGRDFQTLRQEIIDFVKQRAPETWDSNNAADPMIRFIETVAMLGDNLHYYIDAMRREADMATASLASSVYSYALREGYLLVLPRSTHFRVNLYSESAKEIENISFNKFDPFILQNQDGQYYVLTPLQPTTIYSQYPYKNNDPLNPVEVQNPPEIELVAGELKEISFTFSDIDYYSRIELPESRIDAEMCQLIAQSGQEVREIIRVEDVVSDIQQANVFSLTPSFVHGVERLYIEFPYNYRNLFPTNTIFTFRYITIKRESKPSNFFESVSFEGVIGSTTSSGGYREYENPESIKQNYKHYVRDFSSLVTKFDYKSFVNYNINSRCQVFDKSDEYNGNFNNIPVRTMYILSDLAYQERESLRKEILKRSSRSDNIFMIPYGRKLYRAFIIVEANLLSESEESIRSSIRTSLESFYNDISEVRDPIESVIYYKVHSCNSAIARAWVILIEEGYSENGEDRSNFPTETIITDSDLLHSYIDEYNPDSSKNEKYNYIFKFFYDLLPNDPLDPASKDLSFIDRYSDIPLKKDAVINRNILTTAINRLYSFKGEVPLEKPSYFYQYPKTLPYTDVNENLSIVNENDPEFYYDKEDIDTMSVNDPSYNKTHFVLPSLFDTIIWVYST